MMRGPYANRDGPAEASQGRPSDALAANIRACRVLGYMTQHDLAVRMTYLGHGWTRSTVSAVEARKRNVTTDELFGLAVSFGMTIGQLLDPTKPGHSRGFSLDVGLVVSDGSGPRLIEPEVAHLWGASRVVVRLWHDDGREYALDVADDPPMAAQRRLERLRVERE